VADPKIDPDKKRLDEGWMTLIIWAMALDGFTLFLWTIAGVVFIVFMIFVVLAAHSR
jgi:hypothetical protein